MAKPISRKELIRRFRSLGFTGPISGSRHQFVQGLDSKSAQGREYRSVPIKEILRQAGANTSVRDNA